MFGQSRKQAFWQFYSALIGPSSLKRALIGRASCRVPVNVWKFTLGWCSLTTVNLSHTGPVLPVTVSQTPLPCSCHHQSYNHEQHTWVDTGDTPSNKAQESFLLVIVLSKAWYHLMSYSWQLLMIPLGWNRLVLLVNKFSDLFISPIHGAIKTL